jgi:hypothetical protein
MTQDQTYTAFSGHSMLSSGPLPKVLGELKSRFDQDKNALILVFEDQTGRQVDFDLRGNFDDVLARAMPSPPRTGPGRPKLGVVSREISLLPRHWEWLEEQPNGASAALRRLVDQARSQDDKGGSRIRRTLEAAGRFMSAIAGNFANYEEASRALYARDRGRLEQLTSDWPRDIRLHLLGTVGDCI